MSKKLLEAIFNSTPKSDGLLKRLEKKDKQLAQFRDFNDEFRKGFLLAEDIVKEWAKEHFPLTSNT